MGRTPHSTPGRKGSSPMVALASFLWAGKRLLSRLLRLACLAFVLLSVSAASAPAPVSKVSGRGSPRPRTATGSSAIPGAPDVTGPIPAVQPGDPSRNYPFDASLVPVSQYGYTEKEYFFSGDTSVGSYTSRMLVRRPADPAHFSGTVIVEWANDAQKFDLDLLWAASAADIMRWGDAFVLVSAQTEGVSSANTGLKAWSSKRYAPLSMPQDGSGVKEPGSYQIFAQALEAIRSSTGVAPLGGLTAQHVIATGGSESAVTMTTFASQYGSLHGGVDGYLIWDLSTASLGDGPSA